MSCHLVMQVVCCNYLKIVFSGSSGEFTVLSISYADIIQLKHTQKRLSQNSFWILNGMALGFCVNFRRTGVL